MELIQILVLILMGVALGWFTGRLIKTKPRRIPVRARNGFRSARK
ncbi:MAG TPA: hypothetical protein VN364_02200 [Bellilinea sp.]|nr:hypothetical protein [Bellilinea sp.]